MALGDWSSAVQGFVIVTAKQVIMEKMARQMQDIPPEYRITISSDRAGTVVAKMQESIDMAIESRWEPIYDGTRAGDLGKWAENLAQVAGRSLQLAVTSRRIWRGTTPLQLKVKMIFMADYDANVDVITPIRTLQKMAAPDDPTRGLLVSPGPSAFWDMVGDNIKIQIGNILSFKKVVIHRIETSFSTRLSAEQPGKPIAGSAIVYFETYEIVTKQVLDHAYSDIKQIAGVQVDIGSLAEAVGSAQMPSGK
jgi:hypothetical protein